MTRRIVGLVFLAIDLGWNPDVHRGLATSMAAHGVSADEMRELGELLAEAWVNKSPA